MITKTSTAIISLLKKQLPNEKIALYHPHDRGDTTLGLYLYSIRACYDMNIPAPAKIARSVSSLPPRFVTLYYLMTAYSKAEQTHRVANECLILEQAMQIFEQNPVLTEKQLGFKPGDWVDELKLEFVDLEPTEISGIWEHQNSPMKLSAAYRVFPVEIPRGGGSSSANVREVDYGVRTD